ncbi:hypothetical protein Rhe02_49440 [Rhizocola hellebori]|uniref:Uncharacterized protein n=1 Tax=Rhizocola hellebori TaxID=1392758 RepID=A0A8J3QBV8_9ACTN|nr:hypothetical protein [Rhizocola hellebori]GIH06877.1 hypothetical protein Rhe02_49440 [Rhizocola hellebori]
MPDLVIELDRQEGLDELLSSPRPSLTSAGRRWIAAGLVLACLLALGSGGRPIPAVEPVAEVKLQIEGELVSISGELLIDEPGLLTALDSRTARPRWQVRTGLGRHLTHSEGDLVLVNGATEPADGRAGQLWSLGIQMDTGQVRWRLPGRVTVVGGQVVTHAVDQSTFPPIGRLAVYDLAGQPVWAKAPVAVLHAVDLRRQTVLVLDRLSGEMVEYRIDTGGEVARVVLPDLIGATGLGYLDGEVVAFFADGGVVSRQDSEFSRIGFPEGRPERADCGPLWCEYSTSTYDIMLVDKATGELVHRGELWQLAIHTEGGVVGLGPDYGRAVSTLTYFDATTRRAQELTGWRPLGPRLDTGVVSWQGRLFLLSVRPSRTFVAAIDRTGMHVVGSVPYERLTQCGATSYLIACRVDPKTIKVWRPN